MPENEVARTGEWRWQRIGFTGHGPGWQDGQGVEEPAAWRSSGRC
jgi:hypothetical protein